MTKKCLAPSTKNETPISVFYVKFLYFVHAGLCRCSFLFKRLFFSFTQLLNKAKLRAKASLLGS